MQDLEKNTYIDNFVIQSNYIRELKQRKEKEIEQKPFEGLRRNATSVTGGNSGRSALARRKSQFMMLIEKKKNKTKKIST